MNFVKVVNGMCMMSRYFVNGSSSVWHIAIYVMCEVGMRRMQLMLMYVVNGFSSVLWYIAIYMLYRAFDVIIPFIIYI